MEEEKRKTKELIVFEIRSRHQKNQKQLETSGTDLPGQSWMNNDDGWSILLDEAVTGVSKQVECFNR